MAAAGKNKSKKALRVIGILLAVILVLFVGLTVVSHTVYHRSNMATLTELYLRVTGSRRIFSDADKCASFLEERANAEPYILSKKLQSDVTAEQINGSTVYILDPSDTPDRIILYLHGGAYVNDANDNYFHFCNKLAQRTNAEILFPIYPLAPNHTWDETFSLLEQLYRSRLEGAEVPVIIMGDSAGGGLSAAFCECLESVGLRQPDKMILLSPWMDVSMSNPEAADYESVDPMLSAYGLIEMGKCWAGDLDLRDYRVSPIFGDLTVLQNVTLFVGTREIFYPDVVKFYDMLIAQGSTAELIIGEGMNHVYPLYPIPEANTAFEQITAVILN